MKETVFVAGTKDSSFCLSFPAVFILRGSLEEAKSPAGKVLRLIQTSNLRTTGARAAAHQLLNAAQFLRPQLVRTIARGFEVAVDWADHPGETFSSFSLQFRPMSRKLATQDKAHEQRGNLEEIRSRTTPEISNTPQAGLSS